MTEETQETSAGVIGEAQGPPVPEVSAESQSPTSDKFGKDVATILQRLDDLEGKATPEFIRQEAHRAVKSLSDSRLAKVDEILRWVEQSGGDKSKITTDLELSELKAKIASLEGGPAYQQNSGVLPEDEMKAVMTAQTTLLLQGAGIAVDDPRYLALKDKYAAGISSPGAWQEVVKTFVDTVKRQEASSPASTVIDQGGKPPTTGTTHDALLSEYQERLSKIRQGDVRALSELKKEYRKKGLGVY